MKKGKNNPGQKELFPLTAIENSENLGIATSGEPAPRNTPSPSLGESLNESAARECGTTSFTETANAGLKCEDEHAVGSGYAKPTARPGELGADFNAAGDSQVHGESPTTANSPSDTSQDSAGGELPILGASDKVAASPAVLSHTSNDDNRVRAEDTAVSPGVEPNGDSQHGGIRGLSTESDGVAAGEGVELINPTANHSFPKADEPAERVLPDDDSAQVEAAAVNAPIKKESQTIRTYLQVGSQEQDGQLVPADSEVLAQAQPVAAQTAHASQMPAKRKSNPTVITDERDCLEQSERQILDRLKKLNHVHHKLFPNSAPDEVRAAYPDLLTANATCTKTAARNIRKLIEKGFIDLVEPGRAGSGAKYRILADSEVKERRLKKKLKHWVQIGRSRKAVPDPEENAEYED